MFKAVDDDDIKSLKKFLAGNPSGWKVTDKVIDLSTARICLYCNAVFIQYGSTLLHHAAGRGKMECLRYLVEKDGESISRMDNVSIHS